ncbi:AraC-like ligand-binding domain-containing protein [Cupriavidus basilensis]
MAMMEAIRNALVTDAQGQASSRYRLVASSEWDDIRQWSDRIYMPYSVTPTGRPRRPDSVLDATRIGHFTLSRFKYGIPVHISDFSPAAGTGMVLTTLRGTARHWTEPNAFADTGVGDAFVVDNSRTHYWVDFDENHLQINLTFEHDALAALHERWFGRPADESLWTKKFRLGGANSELDFPSRLCLQLHYGDAGCNRRQPAGPASGRNDRYPPVDAMACPAGSAQSGDATPHGAAACPGGGASYQGTRASCADAGANSPARVA